MRNNADTSDRIVDAALGVLARRGLRKLSMTDIGEEAQVSRGTLYRYFASREEVLAAADERVLRTLEEALAQAVEVEPAREDRIVVVLDALRAHRAQNRALDQLVQSQPKLALDFFSRHFPDLLEMMTRYLQPVLQQTFSVKSGAMTEEQLAEVLLRLTLTADVIAAPGSEWLGVEAAALWSSLLAPRDIRARSRGAAPASLRQAG